MNQFNYHQRSVKVIQTGAPGGGPFTVATDTPAAGQTTVTDTTSGNSFVIDAPAAEIPGQFTGVSTTFAGLPTVDALGEPVSVGDWAQLTAEDGTNAPGVYRFDGVGYVLVAPDTSAVLSVTGTGVDNTDPLNPVVDTPFSIDGANANRPLVGDVGVTFPMVAYNVVNAPINWAIDSFSGDITNVAIDATGAVTYDVPNVFSDQGNGLIVVTATDANGTVVTKQIACASNDPVQRETLGGNDDLLGNNPDILNKLILLGLTNPDRVFQDVGKTIPALDGDPVSALENSAPGGGDVVVVGTDGSPVYNANDPDFSNQPSISFSQATSDALEFAVPSAPAQGSAFKFFSVVKLSGTVTNSSIIASTTVGNPNATTNGTWQITDDDGFFAFRFAGGATNITAGTLVGSTDIRSSITRAQMNDGQPHLIYCEYDGTTVRLYWDGVLVVEGDPTQPLYGQYLKIFENRGDGNWVDGVLAEAIYADANLTAAEAEQVQAYLLQKFGLDTSQLSATGPFAVENTLYTKPSQYQLITYSVDVTQTLAGGGSLTSKVFVYDTINQAFYDKNDIPIPGIGILASATIEATSEYVINQLGIDDQSSSGYLDVGNTRIAWGTTPSLAGPTAIVFPGGGFAFSPTVTCSIESGSVRETAVDNVTPTGADLRSATASIKHWNAFGVKP